MKFVKTGVCSGGVKTMKLKFEVTGMTCVALLQFCLTLPVIILNIGYFTKGFKALCHSCFDESASASFPLASAGTGTQKEETKMETILKVEDMK